MPFANKAAIGSTPGSCVKNFLAQTAVIEDIKKYPGIDNYALGIRAGVSESTARRIRLMFFPKKKKRIFRRNTRKRVIFVNLHDCWSMDTMHLKVLEGNAYLQMIVDEKSRQVIAHRLSFEINGELTAGLIRDAMTAMEIVPLAMKFDRGSEFNNDTVMGLLKEKNIIPLLSPGHYPQYNGKNERLNRFLRAIFDSKGIMSMVDTKSEVESGLLFLGQKKPRRIFDGLTCDDVYSQSRISSEEEREELTRQIKAKMEEMKRKKNKKDKWRDDNWLFRKAAEKSMVNMGLLYLKNRLPDYKLQDLNVHKLRMQKDLNIKIGDGYDKYSPDSDVLDAIKEKYMEGSMKAAVDKFVVLKNSIRKGVKRWKTKRPSR